MSTPGRNDPCPCGSGKKFKKCCMGYSTDPEYFSRQKSRSGMPEINSVNRSASEFMARAISMQQEGRLEEAVAHYRQVISIRPDFIDAYFNLGLVFENQGKPDLAVENFRKVISLNPDMADAHFNLGNALKKQGKFGEAISSYGNALALNSRDFEAYYNMGNAFRELGKLEEAVNCFQQAILFKPDYVEAHGNLGNVFKLQGRFDEAIAAHRKAVSFNPGHASAYNYLGYALLISGKFVEAEESFRKALSIMPDLAEAHAGLATLHIDMGQFDAARIDLSRALEFEPENHWAWALLSATRRMTLEDKRWLITALRIVADPVLTWEKMVPLQFSIGKYYDDTMQYDMAFAAYRKANLLKRRAEQKFDRGAFFRLIDAVIGIYTADFFQQEIEGASLSMLPVLVVGMPRSGTSLVEQIIASHPDAFGAGELGFWGKHAAGIKQDATFLRDYEPARVALITDEYQQYLRQYSADAIRIVDKMPGNFLWLGLIHALFPRAKIIHTRRNPLDTCLSVYFQNMLPSHSYGTDLDDLAYYYREYDRLMRHWRSVLPADRFLEVSYETLIDNQAEWIRKIIEFIGLEWDERCLDFHKTERRVGTPSNWQVRQKIYHSSKARCRNYESHLGPLLSLLDLDQGNQGGLNGVR